MNNKKVLTRNEMYEVKIVYKRPIYESMPKITNSKDAVKIIRDFADSDCIDYKEFFWVMLLNHSNKVLGISEIAIGNVEIVVFNSSEIIQLALLTNARCIILAHNHPSGKLIASKSDIELTKKVKQMADIFSITLYDHIIITSENHISLSNENLF